MARMFLNEIGLPRLVFFIAFGLLLGVITALVPQSVQGGFDFPSGVADGMLDFDGERIGRDGTFPSRTIAKLMAEFNLNEADARAKLMAIRENIKKAIDLIKEQDATLGQAVEDALNCERLCLDFKSKDANASALPEGTTNTRKDPINIGINSVACTEVAIHDPAFYQTFTSLMHEAKHAAQSYDPGPLDENADKQEIMRRKKRSCNEIEAEELENSVIDNLIPALE